MQFEPNFKSIMDKTVDRAKKRNYLYITPEHILYTISCHSSFKRAYEAFEGDIVGLKNDLKLYMSKYTIIMESQKVFFSKMLSDIFADGETICELLGNDGISVAHFLTMLLDNEFLFGNYYLNKNANIKNIHEFIKRVCSEMKIPEIPSIDEIDTIFASNVNQSIQDLAKGGIIPIPILPTGEPFSQRENSIDWKELVSCVNDKVEEDSYIPLIGRDKEISETIAVLLRKNKNNPIHIGEPGVGKTAIVEGLAKRINDNDVPDLLKGYKIYSCSMGSLLAGTCYRGEFEQKLKNILEGIESEKAILYIDEIHTIVGAGGDSASNAANILKPYLVNGNIKIIGSTTISEYRKTIEKDAALERRFSTILIEETSKKDTLAILNGIKKYYEDFHNCTYPDAALNAIINLSAKYVNDKYFPDKAIDILDETGAYAKLNNINIVTNDIVEEIIAKKCNIPRDTVTADETSKIEKLGNNMKSIVIGQDSAIDKISESIILSRSGLRDNNKPVANLLFVGPTGVGKTYIAQTLADSLGIPLIRKDMSEFTEAHSVSKLFGSPAGYVGYDEGGLLINEIRKTPYCVLLLDEIEKAHPDVYNVFLQIMDNAQLTDSFGKSADFRNVILIMTSNTGAEDSEKRGIGFNAESMDTSAIDKAVKQTFRPEFRNRLDAIIKFNSMSKEMAIKIAKNQMKSLSDTLIEKHVDMTFDDSAIDFIVEKGYSKEYGARNIKRIIDNDIKLKLGRELLFGSLKNGGNCLVTYKDNDIFLKI